MMERLTRIVCVLAKVDCLTLSLQVSPQQPATQNREQDGYRVNDEPTASVIIEHLSLFLVLRPWP
jgi:hypothetical protein